MNWNCAQKEVIDCLLGSFVLFILLQSCTSIVCLQPQFSLCFYPSLSVLLCLSLSFLSRDLMSWINGIRGLVSSEELAKDVTGAEALLERHQVLESH